ncbi:outer membrane beta-barrel protein [Novosphingobium cyanobacteriorum]|uniref:Outer membrane beta-barrel protein n=1 Tax=Novosphingobium cyanobacteriorum TaxID=3024215 RepID=A0ABT6CGR3_9SPHN|nr:outer membrane beta-barrel protein [Novosphingobium cyanobacteriorum]MDF8332463.1 outer membrane beta-barrel protein [Novosphingobium cyanobacteriorum]
MRGLRTTLRTAAGIGTLACAILQTEESVAQQVVDPRMERDTPSARSRPGFEAIGIAFGSFKLQPSVSVSALATDNLYARSDVKVGDVAAVVGGGVSLQSNWGVHALSFAANASATRYADRSSESTERYSVSTSGRLDLARDTQVSASVGYARRIEARGTTGDTLFGAKPVAYRALESGVSVNQGFGQTKITVNGAYQRLTYEDRKLDGAVIDLGFRNFETVSGGLRVAQAVTPGIAVYVDGVVSRSRYPVRVNNLNRDSTGYSAIAGLLFGNNRLLRGELGAGYLKQNFKDPIFPDISGVNYYANLSWSPSQLTEIRLSASKSFQRAPIANIAGVQQQVVTLSAEHELLRNLILRPRVQWEQDTFRGSAQRNNFLYAKFEAAWLLGTHWEVNGSVEHGLGRNNNPLSSAREFDLNRVTVGLTWRL